MTSEKPDDEGLVLYLRSGEGRFPLTGGTLTSSIRELSHAQIRVSEPDRLSRRLWLVGFLSHVVVVRAVLFAA